jgi:hypothetical protein
MASLPSKRRGHKPVGESAPVRKSASSRGRVAVPVLKPSSAGERENVLRNCEANSRIWALLARLREIQHDLIGFVEEDVDDEAEAALRAAGIAPPLADQPFGRGTFNSVTRPFTNIARQIAEELGMIGINDLPAPPATPATPAATNCDARRAAA